MTKIKMPNLPMSPTDRQWDQYFAIGDLRILRQLVQNQVQNQKEQLARKDAQIARKNEQVADLMRQVDDLMRKVAALKRQKQKSEKDWKWFSDASGGYV